MRFTRFSSVVISFCFIAVPLFESNAVAPSATLLSSKNSDNLVLVQRRGDAAIKDKPPAILGSVGRNKTAKNLNSSEKAKARKTLHNRSIWQHFAAIDSNGDKQLGYKEMVHYFSEMHTVFDRNGDGLVSRKEAPAIMLRYTLSGKSLPAKGLSKAEIARRFKGLFKLVDKNKDGRMSVLEML